MSKYPWEQDPDSVRLAKRKVEDHLMSLDEDTRRKFIDAGMRTTAAFIAEIVRAGILAISKGQTEAAGALGLRPNKIMSLVILPQALRVIIPPLISNYLNLTKNSSLATAIGYPDLVAVFAGTTLNQTGQAVEVISMTMAVYLSISLVISLFMNWYNRHTALIER